MTINRHVIKIKKLSFFFSPSRFFSFKMNNNNDQQRYHILDSYESTENALMDSFKTAALKATGLYKESLVQNRKAYAAGYQQALQDLYEFISTNQPENNGYLPVQKVLEFTREKNSQLTLEMQTTSNTPQ